MPPSFLVNPSTFRLGHRDIFMAWISNKFLSTSQSSPPFSYATLRMHRAL